MENPVDVAEGKEESEQVTEEVKEEELESEVPEEEAEMELEDEADLDEEIEEDSEFIEAKKSSKKEKKEEPDQDIVEERFYTIPLRKVWISPRKKRAPKAARVVRQFVTKHMKINTEAFDEDEELERVVIDNEVNEKLWSRGIEKPPRKIRVRVVKDTEGVVTVLLAEGD